MHFLIGGRTNDCDTTMTEQEYCFIIGVKETEIDNLDKLNKQLTKDLEAARAQLKGLTRDGNSTVQPDLS